jgi:hypothetical protein
MYRIGLVERYGDKYVMNLEKKSRNKIYKYSKEELQTIIEKYKTN